MTYCSKNSARIVARLYNSAFEGDKMSVGKFGSVDKIDPNDPPKNNELKSSDSGLENLSKGACPNCL